MAEEKKPAKPKAAEGKRASADEEGREADLKDQVRAGDEEEEAARAPEREEAEVKAPRRAKKAKAPEAAEGEGEKARKHKPRPRAKLDPATAKALALRRAIDARRPEFHRQEWFRYQRLGTTWRAPQGIQSKMRRHWGTHADVVSVGHRGPRRVRGMHPSGFREVLVHNAKALAGLDPKTEAVRIAASVGERKRGEIQADAKKLGIRVLNWREL